MSQELYRKMIHAILATGDISTFMEAGVTLDWIDDLSAKNAFAVVQEYLSTPGTGGLAPSYDYLAERGVYVDGTWDANDHPAKLAAAIRVARHKAVNGSILSEFSMLNTTDPEGAVAGLIKAISSPEYEALRIRGRDTNLTSTAKTVVQNFLDSVDVNGVTGCPTPFASLTKTTKGWQRGDLHCLYAPKKSMKSFLMLLFALVAWRERPEENVLFVTTEMPSEQLTARLACMAYKWDFNAWRDRLLPVPAVRRLVEMDLQDRWHWYQPSGQGLQAVAEVRSRIAALNMRGGVSLVVWDGHYRSSLSEEWTDVYSLVRQTRKLALEPEIRQPPIIISAQEGSKKGAATHNAYGQEASLMMYLTKVAPDRLLMTTTAVREGPSLEMEIGVSFRTTSFVESSAQIEGDGGSSDSVRQGWA